MAAKIRTEKLASLFAGQPLSARKRRKRWIVQANQRVRNLSEKIRGRAGKR